MSKRKQILGFLIVCTVVVLTLFLLSKLEQYNESKNQLKQMINPLIKEVYEECYSENSLNKNNLSNNDKILLYDCVTPKLDKLTNR